MRISVVFASTLGVFASGGGVGGGCSKSRHRPRNARRPRRRERRRAADPAAISPDRDLIPWIEDDYSRARQVARERRLPLVIDMWAEWCHTCLSMREGVLQDPAIAALASRFVWLALDTENPENAADVARLGVDVWPTFYVVDPDKEMIHATQQGSSSLEQFRAFLERGERGALAALGGSAGLGAGSAAYYLQIADQRTAAGDHAAAAEAYRAALGGKDSAGERAGIYLARAWALYRDGDYGACADVDAAAIAEVAAAKSATLADFASIVVACAELDEGPDAPRLRAAFRGALEALLADSQAKLSIDDRSEALAILREQALATGDMKRARDYAERQKSLLQQSFKEATTGDERAIYVYHLLDVHRFLGELEASIPQIEALIRERPDDYDPPYRLAQAWRELGKWDRALSSAELALERASGPRRATILKLIATLHRELGNRAAERSARARQVEVLEGLPEKLRDSAELESAKAELERLSSREE